MPARLPDSRALFGGSVTIEPVSEARHGGDLWQSFADSDAQGRLWTYMGYGPFAGEAAFQEWLAKCEASADPRFYAIVPRASGKAAGMASLMRITPEHGVIEIGNIWFSPSLQQTREATDALFVMMRHGLDELGYRRLEWKCDALNAASRRAALRLGFTFEGIFRQHMVIKGRNPRHRLVRHPRPRVAAAPGRLPGVAERRQLRRRRQPAQAAVRIHRALRAFAAPRARCYQAAPNCNEDTHGR